MNKYIPTKKELYSSIAAIVLGVFLLSGSIIIVVKKIYSIDEELIRTEATTLGIEETASIKKDLRDWEAQISKLDSFFVNPGEEVAFIEKVEKVGRESGVKIEINSITLGKKSTSTDITEPLNMKVLFEGESQSVARFLSSIETMPYAVSIGNVDINLLNKSLWKGEADVTVLKIKESQ